MRDTDVNRLRQIKLLVTSATAKDSAVTFGGGVLNSLMAAVVAVLVSRSLGPAGFGVLAIFTAVNATIIGITNLGLDATAMKLVSSYLANDRHRAAVVMKVIFWIEIAIGLGVVVIGLSLSRPIAFMLGGDHLVQAVRLAVIAGAFGSAAAFIQPFFVAHRRIFANAIVGLAGGAARLVLVIGLLLSVGLSGTSALLSYTLTPIVFFFLGLAFAPKSWRASSTLEENRECRREIFQYSKWIFLSYVASAMMSRIDVLLLSRIKGSSEVGLYAAATQLCILLSVFIGALSTVLLPRISHYSRRGQFVAYLRKVTFGSLAVVALLLPALIWGQDLINLVFGAKFVGSSGAFKLMFVGYLASIIASPISLVLYVLHRQASMAIINFGQLALSIIANLVLIPIAGVVGAAMSFLVVSVSGAVLSTVVSLRAVRILRS